MLSINPCRPRRLIYLDFILKQKLPHNMFFLSQSEILQCSVLSKHALPVTIKMQ